MTATIDLTDESPPSRRWWLFLAWTGAACVMAFVLWAEAGVPMPWALLGSLFEYYTLGLLAIPLWRWTERVSTAGWTPWRQVLAHIAAALIALIVWRGLIVLVQYASLGNDVWAVVYKGTWMFQGIGAISVYGVVLCGILALQAQERVRTRERRASALALAAREAELGALRANLQPHFVFNALTAVAALVDSDPARARTLVLRLADLLQSTYAGLNEERVPLAREMELLGAYLSVEQIRFGDRLRVQMDADGPAGQIAIPPLILQPIVENAIKHGVAPYARNGEVRVSAAVADGRLKVRVMDSGPGVDDDVWLGQGLMLTRRRLAAVYPADHALRFFRERHGFVVELDVPAHTYAG